jgi:acyl-coenzyme A thioesterase PaaI-like protein
MGIKALEKVMVEHQSEAQLTEQQKGWRAGVSTLISYRYLGTYSEARGRNEAEGWVKVRSDTKGPIGLLAAPIGIALLDTAGIIVDPLAVAAPTRIDLHLFEPGTDVKAVHLSGRILREARSQIFTESQITDAANPDRVIGLGSTHWALSGPNPAFSYVDNRPGVPDEPTLPPLYEAFGAQLREDGNLEINQLTPELGRSGLHQGPFQVVPEAAAVIAAKRALGTDRFWIEHQGTSIIARGIGAPLVTSAQVLSAGETSVNVRVELRAKGADDRMCSVTVCRFRMA